MTVWKFTLEKRKFIDTYAWALIATLISAFIAFFFSFQFGVFFLLFALTAWWVWQNPEEGFLLFIIAAPILPMLKITQTIGTATLIKDVIILTLFLRTCVMPFLQKKLPYRRNILFAPVIGLVLWSSLHVLDAESLILGILRLRDIGLYILLYFAVLYLPHTAEVMKRRLAWFLTSFIIVLFLGAWQWFSAQDSAVLRFDPARQVWIPRLSSVLAHPSIFGHYLLIGSTLALSIATLVREARTKILAALIFIATLPFIYLTYSRAVWIGLVAGVGSMVLLFMARQALQKTGLKALAKYATVSGVAAVIVLLITLRFTSAGVFLRSAFDPTYGSNEERLEFFVRLVAPVTPPEAVVGQGLGDVIIQNFRDVDLEAYDIASGASRSVQLTKNRTLVDNQYLKTFVEMGVIGLVLYGWLHWRQLFGAIKLALGIPERKLNLQPTSYQLPANIIGFWSAGFLIAFLMQAFFIDIWDISPTNALFWIIAALTSQALLPENISSKEKDPAA